MTRARMGIIGFILAICFQTPAEANPQFKWKEVSGASSYSLEVFKDKNFSQLVFQKNVKKAEFEWTDAKPGVYYWRVTAVDSDGEKGDPSAPAIISITVPRLALEEKLKTYRSAGIVPDSYQEVELNWRASQFAAGYEVEVSTDISFKQPQIFKTKTNSLKERLSTAQPFLWRVRPVSDTGESLSQFSEFGAVKFQGKSGDYKFAEADADVEPQGDDFLLINKKRFYFETISIKRTKERENDTILDIKVEGIQPWKKEELTATSRCFGQTSFENLHPTGMEDTWIAPKKSCAAKKYQICMSAPEGRQVCSAWLDERYKKVAPPKNSGFDRSAFLWKGPVPLYWTASDGRSMVITWDKSMERDTRAASDFRPPRFYLAALASSITVQAQATGGSAQNYSTFLGSGQAAYYPESSSTSDLDFNFQRIGAQARYSRSISNVSLSSGQPLVVDWADVSINYRREPSNIFEGQHIYGVLAGSKFSVLGNTTTRAGGGLAWSLALPKAVFGTEYKGRACIYLEADVLPIDVSQDGQGLVFDSKLNLMWLLTTHFFVTGDIEARLINFTLSAPNSLLRTQLGIGYAF